MLKLTLLALAVSLAACSDNDKLPSSRNRDGGSESRDARTGRDGDSETLPSASGLERPPGSLPRPPGNKLPDDLKPPGYAK
jgi:hypothetical protein